MVIMKLNKKAIIKDILSDLFSEFKKDKFYLIPNDTEGNVRERIHKEMRVQGIKDKGAIDLYLFTTEVKDESNLSNVLVKELCK